MKVLKRHLQLWSVIIISSGLVMLAGCDSGKRTVDQITGKESVDQYHKATKDVNDAAKQQSDRLNSIPADINKETSKETDEK